MKQCDDIVAQAAGVGPGHMIGVAAYDDKALAVFNFRSSWIDYDYHDPDA
jgi:hypothetical protein